MKSALIDRLFEEDTDFQSLCEDYYLCTRTLEIYQIEFNYDESTISECKKICRELEKELQRFLIRA